MKFLSCIGIFVFSNRFHQHRFLTTSHDESALPTGGRNPANL